jgi:hypothetical protein
VVAIAVCTAFGLPGPPVPGGGVAKWVSGSETPKNIRPMPMPALNIIATHEMVRNSGSSSSQPSGMLPNLPSASQSTKTTKPDAVSANSQPVLSMIQPRAELDALASELVLTNPQTKNATAMTAVTPKTTLSSPRLRLCTSSSIGTAKIGCGTAWPFGEAGVPAADSPESQEIQS